MRFGRPILAALVGSLVAMWIGHRVAAQPLAHPLTVVRLSTGPDGQTQNGIVEVTMMPMSAFAGVEASAPVGVSSAQFLRLPAGNVVDWHPAPRRQYVVVLSGRGEIELAGGQKIQVNPGQVVLAEDVTGKGHITRSVGSEDLVLLTVPLAGQ